MFGWSVWTALVWLALGGAASRPGGILLGVPTLMEAAAAVAAAAALSLRLGASAGTASLGFLPVPLLLLVAPWPGLRALSGSPLLALAFGGVAAAIVSASWRPPRRLFFPIVLGLYCVVAARAQVQVGPQGDEPHYLMVADSILRDHDVSLADDYAAGRYRAFFDGTLDPHYRVRGRHGEIYSLHAVGLSLLILPAYALGGYPAVSFFMALLAALLAREIRELVRGWSGSDCVAEGVGWLVALSPPLIHYAGLVFTEVPAALAVAVALRRGREPGTVSRSAGLAWTAAIVALPWLNVRYGAVAAILVVLALAARPPRRVAIVLLAALTVSAAALAAWHFHLYGFFDPRRVYGRRPELSVAGVPEGLQGLLLDQEFGLLAYAPVFVLVVPGLLALFRASRRLAIASAALLLVVILTAGAWPMWRGGFNPPARFLVPLVPVLALCLAAVLRRGVGAGTALLIGWGLWTGLAGGWDPRLVHRDRDGTAPFFREKSGAEEWTRLLPAYVLPEEEADRHRLAWVWVAALGVAAAAAGRSQRGPAPTPLGIGLATAGLLTAAVAASRLSDRRTEGRDAVRVVGRPAVATPLWRIPSSIAGRSSTAEWAPADLGWGPAYEPHRHPDGALLGGRLALRPGRYRLALLGQTLSPQGSAPDLVVRAEPSGVPRPTPLEGPAGEWEGSFEVFPGERAVTLTLRGGGPLVLDRLRLSASTISTYPGLSSRREGPR
jgi:hypothetical protein